MIFFEKLHIPPQNQPTTPTGHAENGRFEPKSQFWHPFGPGKYNGRADLEGLECSKHDGNIINRKMGHFYIEAIPKLFSQLRKKIYFFRVQKKFENQNRKKS